MKNRVVKILSIAFILALIFSISLAGCSSTSSTTTTGGITTTPVTTLTTTSSTAATVLPTSPASTTGTNTATGATTTATAPNTLVTTSAAASTSTTPFSTPGFTGSPTPSATATVSPGATATNVPTATGQYGVSWDQAKNYVGQNVTVYGLIVDVNPTDTGVILGMGLSGMSMGGIVIAIDSPNVQNFPADLYVGQTIQVTGMLMMNSAGQYQIMITDPSQVKILNL